MRNTIFSVAKIPLFAVYKILFQFLYFYVAQGILRSAEALLFISLTKMRNQIFAGYKIRLFSVYKIPFKVLQFYVT